MNGERREQPEDDDGLKMPKTPTRASKALWSMIEGKPDALTRIAIALGAHEQTVRRWAWGVAVPRRKYRDRIRDLTGGAVRPPHWFEPPPDEAAAQSDGKAA